MSPGLFPPSAVAVGLAAAVLVTVLFGRLGDRLILWPSTQPIDAGRAARRTIVVPGGVVDAWVTPARTQPARRYLLRPHDSPLHPTDRVPLTRG